MVNDGTYVPSLTTSMYDADGIAASEWLVATFGGGDVAAGGTGARNSANNNALTE